MLKNKITSQKTLFLKKFNLHPKYINNAQNLMKNYVKDLKRELRKENVHMTCYRIKICLTSSDMRKMQLKITED